jgi:hypothetical protein
MIMADWTEVACNAATTRQHLRFADRQTACAPMDMLPIRA